MQTRCAFGKVLNRQKICTLVGKEPEPLKKFLIYSLIIVLGCLALYAKYKGIPLIDKIVLPILEWLAKLVRAL